jgi:hypothetical protein
MECTWFPDLWLNPCCVMHDLTSLDISFFWCVLAFSIIVAITCAIVFSSFVFVGMLIGRPIRRVYLNVKLKNQNKGDDQC